MYGALQAGLADYTMDERGDVGSWIRMVCIKGLADVAELFLTNAPRIPNFADYLPAKDYQRAVGGILKQGVERLDNVRQQAGHHFLRLLVLHLPDVPDIAQWRIHGESFMKELFLRYVPGILLFGGRFSMTFQWRRHCGMERRRLDLSQSCATVRYSCISRITPGWFGPQCKQQD